MERCPICNARLDIAQCGHECSRCKADLSLLFKLKVQTTAHLQLAVASMLNDVNLNINPLLDRADLNCKTKLSTVLQSFNEYKLKQEAN